MLTAPGLNVITRAGEEARRIFERMTAYATYRIAETVRVLLFMTLSILVFNFYPVTALSSVLGVAGVVVAVYGWFVAPIGWTSALLVWAYSLTWFVVNDTLEVGVFRLMRRGAPHRAAARRANQRTTPPAPDRRVTRPRAKCGPREQLSRPTRRSGRGPRAGARRTGEVAASARPEVCRTSMGETTPAVAQTPPG